MRARGIRSYHRPGRMEEALALCAQGAVPLAGGTRLLTTPGDLPNVLDLSALGWGGARLEQGDLLMGAGLTLQQVLDTPAAYVASAGLLPAACRAQGPSRLLRGMATLGGEAIGAAHDSEVAAALLALNAIFRVCGPEGELEIPALRFLRRPADDLRGGALLRQIVLPGPPAHCAALERVAETPSAPALLAVALTLTFAGEQCRRARLVCTGREGPPARLTAAEARLEGSPLDDAALERALAEVARETGFRDDARAPAAYRAAMAVTLTRRALRSALARREQPVVLPAERPAPAGVPTQPLPYFTSGRIELLLNGRAQRFEAEARTVLVDLLRREGLSGAKAGCQGGECGTCVVLLDNQPVAACLTLALRAHGRSVQTVEGVAGKGLPAGWPDALAHNAAAGCGWCAPGLWLSARALLDPARPVDDAELDEALSGTPCQCASAWGWREALRRAAAVLRRGREAGV